MSQWMKPMPYKLKIQDWQLSKTEISLATVKMDTEAIVDLE